MAGISAIRRLITGNATVFRRVRDGKVGESFGVWDILSWLLQRGATVACLGSQTAPHRVRVWRTWFLEGGRDRFADDRRTGRPPKLGPADLTFLDEALQQGPQA